MRTKLKALEGQKLRFRAEVKGFGTKSFRTILCQTVCLINIKKAGESQILCDHVWLTVGATLSKLNLSPGDVLEFTARVCSYRKGYRNPRKRIDQRKIDYKLTNPTKARILQ